MEHERITKQAMTLASMGYRFDDAYEAILYEGSFEKALDSLKAAKPSAPEMPPPPPPAVKEDRSDSIPPPPPPESPSAVTYIAGEAIEVKRSNGDWLEGTVLKVTPGTPEDVLLVEYVSKEGKTFQKKLTSGSEFLAKIGSHLFVAQLGQQVELLKDSKWIVATVSNVTSSTIEVQYTLGSQIHQFTALRSAKALAPLGTHTKVAKPASTTGTISRASGAPKATSKPVDKEDTKEDSVASPGEMTLGKGDYIDVRDATGKWHPCEIIDAMRPDRIHVHYLEYSSRWDEWLSVRLHINRIAAFNSATQTTEDPRFVVGTWVQVLGEFGNYGPPRWVEGVVQKVDRGQVLVAYDNLVRTFKRWYLVSSDEIRLLGEDTKGESGESSTVPKEFLNETEWDVTDMLEIFDPRTDSWKWVEVIDACGKKILVRGEGILEWIHVDTDKTRLRNLAPAEEAVKRKEQEALFCEEIESLGFKVIDIERDGNCLFRAFAVSIYNDSERHMEVRNKCYDYMLANAEYFASFFSDSLEEYVKENRASGKWGGEPELFAMSELFNKRIELFFQGMEEQPTIRMNEAYTSLQTVRLSYHGHSHYNCVIDPKRAPPLGDGSKDAVRIRDSRAKVSKDSSSKEEKYEAPTPRAGRLGSKHKLTRDKGISR